MKNQADIFSCPALWGLRGHFHTCPHTPDILLQPVLPGAKGFGFTLDHFFKFFNFKEPVYMLVLLRSVRLP